LNAKQILLNTKVKQKIIDYAVDGVLLYSSHLSQEFNVLSIAVSGEVERELKISHFFQAKKSSFTSAYTSSIKERTEISGIASIWHGFREG